MSEAGPSWESLPRSELTPEQILTGFVDLVIGAHSMRDVTPKAISDAVRLDLQQYDDGDVGTYARLTPEWSYSLRLFVDLAEGPMLRLSFLPRDREHTADLAVLPGLELEGFAECLVGAGFSRERRYGEHGRILGDEFVRDELTLQVAFRATTADQEAPFRTILWVTVD